MNGYRLKCVAYNNLLEEWCIICIFLEKIIYFWRRNVKFIYGYYLFYFGKYDKLVK